MNADWHKTDVASGMVNVRYQEEEPTSDIRSLRSAFGHKPDLAPLALTRTSCGADRSSCYLSGSPALRRPS